MLARSLMAQCPRKEKNRKEKREGEGQPERLSPASIFSFLVSLF